MDITNYLLEQIGQQGIWFGLFIYLFLKQDKKNAEREIKMETQLSKSDEQLSKSIEALQELKTVNKKLDDLADKINR